jgi:hypothetical protein
MRIRYIVSTLILGSLAALSCDRENAVIKPAPYPTGSKDLKNGRATLRVTPRHHLKDINNSTVYIKYGSQKPVDAFDDSAKVQWKDNRPIAEFTNLTRGDYYLYATGENPEIKQGDIKLVTGGGGFTVIDTTEKSYNIYLDVFSVYE